MSYLETGKQLQGYGGVLTTLVSYINDRCSTYWGFGMNCYIVDCNVVHFITGLYSIGEFRTGI